LPIDIVNESTVNARGGTELMAYALQERLDPALLDKFQIIPSRVRELDPNRKRILWLHDLPGDPESEHLHNGGYNKFERLVFVSNWQMQKYIEHYGIPWYKCIVMRNAIVPIDREENLDPEAPIRLIYHTTPHRGLDILASVFEKLAEDHNVHLDVFSSFGVYGWQERDAPYEGIFEFFRNHPKSTYHGAQPNEVVKAALSKADIFAYPNTWLETSCISLIEAMSAGTLAVHPNYGALYETAAGWTSMYQYRDNKRDHAQVFYDQLRSSIDLVRTPIFQDHLFNQKMYIDRLYNWDVRAAHWDIFLKGLL
jgi:glycosyltransferase involved in cell wall biosynthesis